MRLDTSRPLFIRLLALAFLVLVPPVALVSFYALAEFERGMAPELDRKAAAVGHDLQASVERAVGLGIPIDRLVGVDAFFAPVLKANPEIRYLAVTDRDGNLLFLLGAEPIRLEPHYRVADFDAAGERGRRATIDAYVDLALPIAPKGQRVGQVHVGVEEAYVRTRLAEIPVDIAMVLVVALLVATEVLVFVVTFNVIGPMRLAGAVMDKVRRGDFTAVAGVVSGDEVGRFVAAFNAAIRRADDLFRRLDAYIDEVKSAHFDKSVVERVADIESRVKYLFRFHRDGQPEVLAEHQATDIRLPLFLFVFAEELSRSFMPLYIRDLLTPLPWIGPEMAIALPIALFMACIAAASPWAARLTSRLGSRRVFLAGLLPATLGLALSGLAYTVYDFLLWRTVTALGYAMITMACQGYISQVSQTHEKTQAQGLGVYVGAVLTASVCGIGIGGVLAERVGFRATFVVAAALAALSGVLILRLMSSGLDGGHRPGPDSPPRLTLLLRNWRFAALVAFAAIPSKIALTAFFFYLVPLTVMRQAGADVADVARVMMIYPVAVVILSPLAARLADRTGFKVGLVALGGLIGGAGLVAPAVFGGIAPVAFGVLMLGISHGLSASPQLAMVPDLCWTECRTMGQANVLAFLRVAERVGSIAGPLLAAAFIPLYGYQGAAVAVGVVVLGLSSVFALLSFAYGAGPHIQEELA